MEEYLELIEKSLEEYLPSGQYREQNLIDSMKYSLLSGGKRVRPTLTLEFCSLCGGDIKKALPFACAVEMIHAYSLIHDDLPCMDDDEYRRGKLTNHKVFGEDIALLAGDSLQSLAFSTVAEADVEPQKIVKAISILSNYCGALGMVGGQVIDLESEDKNVPIEVLEELDTKKTAALIKAACEMGCVIAGASEEEIDAARTYAQNIGIAFQIVDDILDYTKSTEELGKTAKSDITNNKSTYLSLLGMDECKNRVDKLTSDAIDSLKVFKNDTTNLCNYAIYLRDRQK